jgi:hypothetical protein
MSTEAQQNASRENGKKSRGAITPEGRAICCRNAVKHALTGQTVILEGDDIEAYQKLCAIIFKKFNPQTDPEHLVVQDIADTEWRLRRIPVMESGLFQLVRTQQAEAHADMDPEERRILLDGQAQFQFTKAFTNLTLQESRLQRKLERKTAEFKELRAERELIEVASRNTVMSSILGESVYKHPSIGFEFSKEFLIARIEFIRYAPNSPKADVAAFDRSWRDKSSKTPH